jgi:filamentous hemagglutinin family protein
MNMAFRPRWSSAKDARLIAVDCVTGKGLPAFAITLFTVALLAGPATDLRALPLAPQVVSGQATFSSRGSTLTVTNSDRAIINWDSFSINSGEMTKFIQPTSLSSVLNRVVGANPSAIYGTLQSNGKVYLVNQNGIFIGPDALIDSQSFIASTLAIQNADFITGKVHFTAGSLAGKIENQGTIRTPDGGSIYLIATDVSNSGIITAPNGDILLAAGHQVSLVDSAEPDLAVVISAPEHQALNMGQIIVAAGKIGIYGGLIKQKGFVSADSAVAAGGKILFKATRSIELDEKSRTRANGVTGGDVRAITAENGVLSGTLTGRGEITAHGDGSAGSGGFVETSAARVDLHGIRVDTGGGIWLIDPFDYLIAPSGGDISGATLSANLELGSVAISSDNGATGGNGDILVNDAVSWASANTLSLLAVNNVAVNQPVTGLAGTLNLTGAAIYNNSTIAVAGTTLKADQMTLGGSINAGAGRVNIFTTTVGRPIDLGTKTAGSLGITNAELNTITAGVLQVGDYAIGGQVNLTAALNPANVPVLDIESATGITQTAGSLTVPGLALRSKGTTKIDLEGANDVTTLAATQTGGSYFVYEDMNDLTVGTVDGLAGVFTNGPQLNLFIPSGNLTINNDVYNSYATSNGIIQIDLFNPGFTLTNNATITSPNLWGSVMISADDMVLNAGSTISAASRVDLGPGGWSSSRSIDLGSNTAGMLGLTNAELCTITTPLLRINGTQFGSTTISANIAPTGISTLDIGSWNAISGPGVITVPTLGLAASYGSAGVYGNGGGVIDVRTAVDNIAAINTFTDDNPPNPSTSYPITINNTAPSGTLNIIGLTYVDGIRNANGINSGTASATISENSPGGNIVATTAPLVASSIQLTAGGGMTLTSANNQVGSLSAVSGGVLNFVNNGSFSTGTITSAAALSLQSIGGNIAVGNAAVVASGDLTLDAGSGTFSLTGAAANVKSTGVASTVSIIADNFSIAPPVVGIQADAATGRVVLQPKTADRSISIDAAARQSGALGLLGSDFSSISAATVALTTTGTGGIVFNDNISIGSRNLCLTSGGSVTQPGGSITAGGLELLGSGSFSLTAANSIGTLAGNAAGSISVINGTGNLTIDTVNTTAGLASGSAVTVRNDGGALTVGGSVSAGTDVSLATNAIGGTVTLLTGAAITAGGGVTLATALQGADIVTEAGSSITATSGDIRLNDDAIGSAIITAGDYSAPAGAIVLTSSGGLNLKGGSFTAGSSGTTFTSITDGIIQANAPAPISIGPAGTPLLLNPAAGFGSQLKDPANTILSHIISLATAGLEVGGDSNGLKIANVGSTGSVKLVTTGPISQTGLYLQTPDLSAQASGGITFSATGNNVKTVSLANSGTGSIFYASDVGAGNALQTGFTNSAAGGSVTVTEKTGDIIVAASSAAAGPVSLAAAGALTIKAPVTVPSGQVFLSGTTIGDDYLSPAVITAQTLGLRAASQVNLSNAQHKVNTVAAEAGGSLSITTAGSLTVTAVRGGEPVATVTGVTAPGGVNIWSGGSLFIQQPITAPNGPIFLAAAAPDGSIIDMNSNVSVVGASLSMNANGGIGGLNGGPLKIRVALLDGVVNNLSGNINIANNDAAQPASLSARAVQNRATTGNLAISNFGAFETLPAGDGVVPVSASGSVTLMAHSPLTIGADGVSAGSGVTLEAGSSGTLTINGPVQSVNPGSRLILQTSGPFINSIGSGALSPGSGGSWQIWSADPSLDSKGGLVANFKQYNAQYGSTPVTGSGNGFLYSLAPLLTPTLTGTVTKVYDGTSAALLTSGNYGAVTGMIDGDGVTLNNPVSGSFATKGVGSGKLVTVTGLSVTGTNAGVPVYGYRLPASLSAAIGTITPATVTTSGLLAQDKVYDATTTAQISGGSLVGVMAGDAVTISANGTFADKNVGTGKPVAASFTLSGADAGNYLLSPPVGLQASITPAFVTTSGAAARDKVYDATTVAQVNGGSLVGVMAGDAVAVSASGSFADKNVGTGKAVAASFSLGGADAGNYLLSPPVGLRASITPAFVTTSGAAAQDKVYDATTVAQVNGGSLVGGMAGDAVTISASGSFADKNVGTGKTVAASFSLGGVDAGNYLLSPPVGLRAAITPAALTTSGAAAQDKVYDATTVARVSGGSLVGVMAGDAVTISASGTFADKNVGTGKAVAASFSLGGADAGNYLLSSPVGLRAAITPAFVTASGATAQDKVYDATTVAQVSGGSLAGVMSGDAVTISASGSFADKNVGTGKAVAASFILSGVDAGNYLLSPPAGLTAAITPAFVTTSGLLAQDKVYDATTIAQISGGSLVGVMAGDAVTVSASGSFADKNVGTGKPVAASFTLSGTDAGNYLLSPLVGLRAAITPAFVTTSGAAAQDKVYDATTVARVSGGSLVGVMSGDAVTVSASGSFADKNVGTGKPVAASFTLGGADAGNYLLSPPVGLRASITPAFVTTSGAAAQDKVYDATTVARVNGGSLVGVMAGDAVTISASGTFADKNVGTGKAVVARVTLGGVDAGNYQLSPPVGLTAAITPASVTTSGALAQDKVYDATTVARVSGGSLVGVMAGDTVTISASGSFADKNVGTGKAVAANFTLGGADAGNYLFSSPEGLTANITVRPLATWTGSSGGLWSDPENWDALPDGANVRAVVIPAGPGKQIIYDALAGSTTLDTLTSSQNILMTGGHLSIVLNMSSSGFEQAGGVLSCTGAMTVTNSFNQSGGSIELAGTAPARLQQLSGNMNIANITAPAIDIGVAAGAITQTGPIVTPLLTTASSAGTSLKDNGNRIAEYGGANSSSGDIHLINSVPITISRLDNAGGGVVIENHGEITTGSSRFNVAGTVTMVAHSPLTIGTGGISSGGDISLEASPSGAAGTADLLTLNGPIVAGGNVLLKAGGLIIDNVPVVSAGNVLRIANLNTPSPDYSTSQTWEEQGNTSLLNILDANLVSVPVTTITADATAPLAPSSAEPGSSPPKDEKDEKKTENKEQSKTVDDGKEKMPRKNYCN